MLKQVAIGALVLGGVYGIGYIYHQQRYAKAINVNVNKDSLRIITLSASQISIGLDVVIENPSDLSFIVYNYGFNIFWNDKFLSKIENTDDIKYTIGAKSKVTIPVKVSANPVQAAITTIDSFILPIDKNVRLQGFLDIMINNIFMIRKPIDEVFNLK